jgi:copper chaperone CopZ
MNQTTNITRVAIEGLHGATDTEHIEKALEAVPRVQSVEIDPAAGSAIVRHDGARSTDLVSALGAVGYRAVAS